MRRGARPAIGAVFFAHGALFASWVSRIPGVKEASGLSEARLAVALFAMSAGTFCTLPVATRLTLRYGSRAVAITAALAACLVLPAIGACRSLPLLASALFLLGATLGGVDVPLNALAAALERERGRSIMAAFHGLWSLGGLAGAALGGRFAAAGVPPLTHFAAVAALLAPAMLAAAPRLALDAPSPAPSPTRAPFAWPSGAVLRVGLLGACSAIVEGGIADWSGVYLRALGGGPGTAAAGFAAFSLAMTAARFGGDRLIDRLGPLALLRAGALITATALAFALATGVPWAAVGGFALAGLGISAAFPIAFSAAGNIPVASTSIAAVATMSYGAGLAGPPAIGLAATATSLRIALVSLVALSVAIAALAGNAKTHPRHQS